MQWWCAAQGVPWTWAWQPYPGVWLFIGLLALGYLRATRGDEATPRQRLSFFGGLAALWIALDWPVGALGAGYLASIHMVQFLLIALLAPPFIIGGIPRRTLDRWASRPGFAPFELLTRPLIALFAFQVVIIATHWPGPVDRMMSTQLGSAAIDLAWLFGGLLFWWPVVSPVPHRPRFPFGIRIGYLIACTVLMTLPYVFLTFAELPFYATYELAPPVGTMSAGEDQRLAGLIMRIGGGAILWTAAGIVFWLWYRAENEVEAGPRRVG